MHIDLNADLGHGLGDCSGAAEGLLWPLVSSALVPCGAHAGDPTSILHACSEAAARGVAVGAAVGYRDRIGGGLRFVDYDADDLAAEIIYQLGGLDGLALSENVRVSFVRPAGALFEATRTDRNHAWAVVNAVLDYDPTLTIVGSPGSRLLLTAERHGLATAAEFLPHRLLSATGALGPVVTDPEVVAQRALDAAASGAYATIRLPGETAVERSCAAAVHQALVEAGYQPRALEADPAPAHATAREESRATDRNRSKA